MYVRGTNDFIKRCIHHARYVRTTVSISLKWRFGGHPLTFKTSFRTRVECFASRKTPGGIFLLPFLSTKLDRYRIGSQGAERYAPPSYRTYFSWIETWNGIATLPRRYPGQKIYLAEANKSTIARNHSISSDKFYERVSCAVRPHNRKSS
jgi:hypothetical protein